MERKPRVLIVDDIAANIEVVGDILGPSCEILFATAWRDAMLTALRESPDVILLDVMMPDVDGFEVCKRLKADPGTADIPVIFLTARTDADDIKRGFEAGGVDYVAKPFRAEELLGRVRVQVQLRRMTESLRRSVEDLHRAQDAIIRRERLRALGEMARGVAHDFNNALQPIMLAAGMLAIDDRIQQDKAARSKLAQDLLSSVEAAARTVRRLVNFYRTSETKSAVSVDVATLAEAAIEATRPRWESEAGAHGKQIEIVRAIESPAFVDATADDIREIFSNLIFNAEEAIEKSGTITVGVRSEGRSIIIEVSDTGRGMTEEDRARCLEPFFTTDARRGRGLGLSIVYGAVQRQGGEIHIESLLGRGTTVTIRLPATEKVPIMKRPEAAPFTASVLRAARPTRILFVDDDASLLEAAATVLEQTGYTVDKATSAREAMRRLREAPFDIMITDFAMPEMNGLELARWAARYARKVPVIMLTGFADDFEAAADEPSVVRRLLVKPVSIHVLVGEIEHVLAEQE